MYERGVGGIQTHANQLGKLVKLLSHAGPLSGTTHFTLKMEAASSSEMWHPVAKLHGVIIQ
jgi:hypothetical protein